MLNKDINRIIPQMHTYWANISKIYTPSDIIIEKLPNKILPEINVVIFVMRRAMVLSAINRI